MLIYKEVPCVDWHLTLRTLVKSSKMAKVPPPPPPPPIVIGPDEVPPPAAMGPVPPITLLEGLVEPFVSVCPGGLLEFTLRVNYIYHIEGYGIVPYVWEDVRILHPVALPLRG